MYITNALFLTAACCSMGWIQPILPSPCRMMGHQSASISPAPQIILQGISSLYCLMELVWESMWGRSLVWLGHRVNIIYLCWEKNDYLFLLMDITLFSGKYNTAVVCWIRSFQPTRVNQVMAYFLGVTNQFNSCGYISQTAVSTREVKVS